MVTIQNTTNAGSTSRYVAVNGGAKGREVEKNEGKAQIWKRGRQASTLGRHSLMLDEGFAWSRNKHGYVEQMGGEAAMK